MQNKSWKPTVQDMRRSSMILKLITPYSYFSRKLCITNRTNQLHSYIPWSEDESLPSEGAGLTWTIGGVTGGLVSKSILDGAEKDAKRAPDVVLVVLDEVAGVTLIEGLEDSLVGHCIMGLLAVDESSGKRESVSMSSSDWRSFSGSPTRLQGSNLQ